MEYLADTVAIIRFFSQTGKLGKSARNIFSDTEDGKKFIWISIISLVEIMYLVEKNRISLDLKDFILKIKNSENYRIMDLDVDIIEVASKIKGLELHDRLIVATAKHLDIPIIISDQVIIDSGIIRVIWS